MRIRFLTARVTLLFLVSTSFSQSFVDSESDFLDIPNQSGLTPEWFFEASDSSSMGLTHPPDIDVLKLSPADYRVVVLNADPSIFATFKLDQTRSLQFEDIAWSGDLPNENGFAASMCPMTNAEFFNPETDCVAVVFKVVPEIGIYKFNKWNNTFALVDTIQNAAITHPIGIFWAFGDFFIVDENDQKIYRTDRQENIRSVYGYEGEIIDYEHITDISGYVDGSNVAHLFVGEGINMRADHLTAVANDDSIYFKTWAWSDYEDPNGMFVHAVAYVPGAGLAALDRSLQRLYLWPTPDTLYYTARDEHNFNNEHASAIHLRSVLGRLVVVTIDSTGWNLNSYIADNAILDNPEPAYPDTHWKAAMSPIYVTDSVIIGSGQHLTIDADVEVQFDAGTCIRVNTGGTLTVNGTSNDRVVMKRMNYGEAWDGIKVYGGNLDIEYVSMYDCDSSCIYTNAPAQVIISYCHLDGSTLASKMPALSLNNDPRVTQNVTGTSITNVPIGFGLNLSNCNVRFDDVIVSGCSAYNTFMKTTTGTFTNCRFKDRASTYGVVFSSAGTTPNFKCCEFNDISPQSGAFNSTIFASSGTAPTFGYEGSSGSGVSNVFNDSCSYILKMYGSGVLPIIQRGGNGPGGRNDWYQRMASGKYISWSSPYPNPLTAYFAKSQYWDREPVSINDFNPASASYFTLGSGEADPWELCGGATSSIGGRGAADLASLDDEEVDPLDSLFTVALALEIDEEYSAAQPIFRNVASNSLNFHLVWQAMTHIISCQRMLDPATGEAWIPAMLDSLMIADSSTYGTQVYANRLLGTYRLARAEYNDAIEVLVGLLESELSEEDSIYVALDIIGVQMAASNGSSGGGLDEYGLSGVPSTLRVLSESEGARREWELLDALNRLLTENEPTVQVAIPTEYRLYQNYPNPFNPTTQIEFDLPERIGVTVRIFNTLGQEVATLGDQAYPAGHHVLTWNGESNSGKDTASGLYIYQIQAGSFTDAKKMVLLR